MTAKYPTDLGSAGTLALEYGMTVTQLRQTLRGRAAEYRIGQSVLFSKREVQDAIALLAKRHGSRVRSRKARECTEHTP